MLIDKDFGQNTVNGLMTFIASASVFGTMLRGSRRLGIQLRTFSQSSRRLLPRARPGFDGVKRDSGNVSKGSVNSNSRVSDALQETSKNNENSLISPVHIPEDRNAILRSSHPSTSILANSSIVVQRQLEMMNVFLGFEQANRYVIMDAHGNHIGYLAEQEHGLGNLIARQTFRTHRSFTTHVFNREQVEVLRFHRPFSWISSRIRIYDAINAQNPSYESSSALQDTAPGTMFNQEGASISSLPISEMRIVGEAQQQWAPLKRKYNLFLSRDLSQESPDLNAQQLTAGDLPLSNSTALQTIESSQQQMGFAQFAKVDEPFLSWDFSLLSADDQLIGSVNRNFVGFARELFTDTGVYALRMDSAGISNEPDHWISQTAAKAERSPTTAPTGPGMTLDQRAVMLATAVSIDFDYFSRHSHAGAGGPGFMPLWFPMGGGGAEAGAAEGTAEAGAAGGAAEAGAGEGAATGAAGRGVDAAGRGYGPGEGAITGAGTMAGYEAMQRGRETWGSDDASPNNPQSNQDLPSTSQQHGENEDFSDWGGGGSTGGGGGGTGGGDGGGFDIDDFF